MNLCLSFLNQSSELFIQFQRALNHSELFIQFQRVLNHLHYIIHLLKLAQKNIHLLKCLDMQLYRIILPMIISYVITSSHHYSQLPSCLLNVYFLRVSTSRKSIMERVFVPQTSRPTNNSKAQL